MNEKFNEGNMMQLLASWHDFKVTETRL